MKRFALLIIALLWALPAAAQNNAQIQSVQNGANCSGCNLFQGSFGYSRLGDRDLSNARLIQADFTVTEMPRINLSGANLSHANMFGVTATSGNFSGANLTRTNLTGSWLLGANFSGATFDGTVLNGARMETARGLTQGQLNNACGDAATSLPAGLTIPSC